MKKTILAGAIAAMMLASAATSAVTCAQDNNAKSRYSNISRKGFREKQRS